MSYGACLCGVTGSASVEVSAGRLTGDIVIDSTLCSDPNSSKAF